MNSPTNNDTCLKTSLTEAISELEKLTDTPQVNIQNGFEEKSHEKHNKSNEEKKLKAIFDNSPDAIVLFEKNGVIADVNNRVFDWLGYHPKEIIGKNFKDLHFLSLRNKLKIAKNLLKRISGQNIPRYEIEFISESGEVKTGLVSASTIRNEKGKISQVLVLISNITEQKKSEEKIQKLVDTVLQERSLFNKGPVVVFKWKNQSGWPVENVSPNIKDVLGYSEEDLVTGKIRYSSIILEDDLARVKEEVHQNSTSGANNFAHIPYRIIRGDGSVIWIADYTTIIRNKKREITHYQGYILDITAHKNAEEELITHKKNLEGLVLQRTNELLKINEELIEAKNKAEESDKLKSAFLSNMSHEIRTPMNAIIGFAELLHDHCDASEIQTEYINIISSKGNLLLNLINDIIDISKVEANELEINKSACDVTKIAEEIFLTFQKTKETMQKSHIDLRMIKPDKKEDLTIFTDPYRLKQILTNLVDNALKFTLEGYVEINYYVTGSGKKRKLKFCVKDTGIGIPIDKQNIVFNRFQQVEDSLTREFGGTGLGLTISKKLVELLGGTIGLESELGKGSLFYFSIPFDRARESIKSSSTIEYKINKVKNWEDKVILIVEDDLISFELIRSHLKDTKVNIIHAKNGQNAVDICRQNANIDLVIMDIQLPEMNGYEATQSIKSFRHNIPIIAQTAYAMPGEKEKCLEVGCNDYISKPIDSQLLLEKINKYFIRQ